MTDACNAVITWVEPAAPQPTPVKGPETTLRTERMEPALLGTGLWTKPATESRCIAESLAA